VAWVETGDIGEVAGRVHGLAATAEGNAVAGDYVGAAEIVADEMYEATETVVDQIYELTKTNEKKGDT